ncbi:MAG: NYN domain-containing protein [Candidatus Uhrbacteria bacterium]|nr:NYN domain-containing protein [Candidatus Uhrbacteria bacterium]
MYVDAENILIPEGRPFAPGVTDEIQIRWLHDFCATLALDIIVYIFIDLTEHPKKADDTPEDIARKLASNKRKETVRIFARTFGFDVVHAERRDGKDDVDLVLMNKALQDHQSQPQHIPFVIASEDSDYKPLIERLREGSTGRPVYLALPASSKFPRHSNPEEIDAWGWLDPNAQVHRLMYWLFGSTDREGASAYIERFIMPHYEPAIPWRMGANALLKVVQNAHDLKLNSYSEKLEWVERAWKTAGLFSAREGSYPPLSKKDAVTVLPYLEHYGFFEKRT